MNNNPCGLLHSNLANGDEFIWCWSPCFLIGFPPGLGTQEWDFFLMMSHMYSNVLPKIHACLFHSVEFLAQLWNSTPLVEAVTRSAAAAAAREQYSQRWLAKALRAWPGCGDACVIPASFLSSGSADCYRMGHVTWGEALGLRAGILVASDF